MEPFTIDEPLNPRNYCIVVVGIGGSGYKIIEHMQKAGNGCIELIAADIDHETEALKGSIEGADIVFITFGLGGTRSAKAPWIAKMAKDAGALVIGVVTKPFSFEGKRRKKAAELGLVAFKKEVDTLIVFPDDRFLEIIDPKLGIRDSFKIIDSYIADTIEGISGTILSSGDNDISLDLEDLQSVMSNRGVAFAGVGESSGEKAEYEAINEAFRFAPEESLSLKNVSGIIVHFTIHPEFRFMRLSAAMDIVHDSIGENAEIIFGTTTDDSLSVDFIRVMFVATGFQKRKMVAVNNVY